MEVSEKPLRSSLLFCISDEKMFNNAIPLLREINRPGIVLYNKNIDIEEELPQNICLLIPGTEIEEIENTSNGNRVNCHDMEKLKSIYLSIFKKINIEGIITWGKRSVSEIIIQEIGREQGITTLDANAFAGNISYIVSYLNKIIPFDYDKSKRKLNLGCGQFILSGWINVDLHTSRRGILHMDMGKTYPFPSNSFDFIFSEHAIEHLNYRAQQKMLSECFRILKPGGAIRIATPDLQFLLDLANQPNKPQNKRYLEWSFANFDYSYVNNSDINICEMPTYIINKFMRSWGHEFIHTPSSLIKLGKEARFINPVMCKPNHSQFIEMENIDSHHHAIPQWANNLETLIVEFIKPNDYW